MIESYKHLFQRSLAAAPERLHFAAHSHHLWPDASYLGHLAAWEDAARLADRKWDRAMGEIWPAAQRHVAAELRLPDSTSVVFAPNTHLLLLAIVSALPSARLRILASDGEFHSFRRQAARWVESGRIALTTVPVAGGDFVRRFVDAAARGDHDLIFVSQVMFGSGTAVDDFSALADMARPEGPWLAVDGYHGFMAIDTDWSSLADRAFYLAGGYKYAMSGEGVAFLHVPSEFGARPEITGWYAEFEDLSLPPGGVGYAPDARRFLGATFDPSGLYRFVAVRDMLAREGLTTAVISAHCAGLRDAFLAHIGETALAGAQLLNAPGQGPQARFLAFRSPHAAAWQAALSADGIVTDVRGDVLRIGFGLYHDLRDVARLAAALARVGVG